MKNNAHVTESGFYPVNRNGVANAGSNPAMSAKLIRRVYNAIYW